MTTAAPDGSRQEGLLVQMQHNLINISISLTNSN